MPPHMFEKSTSALGRWSDHTESLFAVLDETFLKDRPSVTRQPLARGKWDDRSRSSNDVKKLRLRLEALASKLLVSHRK